MIEFIAANLAPIMFGAVVFFLISGFPVAFALAAGFGVAGALFALVAVLALAGLLGATRQAHLLQHGTVEPQAGRIWLTLGLDALLTLGLVALTGWLLLQGPFALYRVPSLSMWPTLRGGDGEQGDVILIDRSAYWLREPSEYSLRIVP